ncbi:hypothetical protein Ait01nite_050540 [Actinoplanes italicus]|uniref:Uncharacterized protein n=2 Tax=Actinoplanes italicus TaxID=113567 RepID=A0A2T0KBH6_9ACTN|nr:hypothetical protein CLV67_108344 [Actinoplanes italicus]GIE32009.1 hypothetical protein Ait01nite_050540 [Actinoplanes italicus]
MVPMAQDDPHPESVITFGDDDGAGTESARQRFLRGLARDRRLPVLVAGLGAVAAFGSLISEWQTTTIDGLMFDADGLGVETILLTRLLDLGGVGGGYLGGLSLVAVTIVLTLFGPAPGRPYARLAGFALGGVLLALIMALVQHLNTTSVMIPQYYTAELDSMRMAHGRGLWCALAAVVAALITLWLGPRATGTPQKSVETVQNDHDDPLDLSITPAAPFARFPGELDQPHRS